MTGVPAWIGTLGLGPHPEGGYFRRIYTATQTTGPGSGARPLATSIYYLLDTAEPRGRLHRNRSDILHFLLDGGPIDYVVLAPSGDLRQVRLSAEARFLLVPGQSLKASRLAEGASHGLVSEVVTPGFDYADHEFATAEVLRNEHPGLWPVLEPYVR